MLSKMIGLGANTARRAALAAVAAATLGAAVVGSTEPASAYWYHGGWGWHGGWHHGWGPGWRAHYWGPGYAWGYGCGAHRVFIPTPFGGYWSWVSNC
ncbi:MAG TPA: sulfur globule protein precursor [Roseiarcus sp.]|nr:sulfur globule protein precursor [Roseiarcus sp.]